MVSASSRRRRKRVIRDEVCAYCRHGVPVSLRTADHVTPRSRAPTAPAPELVMACRPCNCAKGSMLADLFRAWLKTARGAAWAAARPAVRARAPSYGLTRELRLELAALGAAA